MFVYLANKYFGEFSIVKAANKTKKVSFSWAGQRVTTITCPVVIRAKEQ